MKINDILIQAKDYDFLTKEEYYKINEEYKNDLYFYNSITTKGYKEFIRLVCNHTMKTNNISFYQSLLNKYHIDIFKNYNLSLKDMKVNFIDSNIENFLLKRNWIKQYSNIYKVDTSYCGNIKFINKNHYIIFRFYKNNINHLLFNDFEIIVYTDMFQDLLSTYSVGLDYFLVTYKKYNKIKRHINQSILTNNKYNKSTIDIFNKFIPCFNKLSTICKLKNKQLSINKSDLSISYNFFTQIKINKTNNCYYINLAYNKYINSIFLKKHHIKYMPIKIIGIKK